MSWTSFYRTGSLGRIGFSFESFYWTFCAKSKREKLFKKGKTKLFLKSRATKSWVLIPLPPCPSTPRFSLTQKQRQIVICWAQPSLFGGNLLPEFFFSFPFFGWAALLWHQCEHYNPQSRVRNCLFVLPVWEPLTLWTHALLKLWSKKKKEKCRGTRRATAAGGNLCGIQKKESFWDEQDAVGVSTPPLVWLVPRGWGVEEAAFLGGKSLADVERTPCFLYRHSTC